MKAVSSVLLGVLVCTGSMAFAADESTTASATGPESPKVSKFRDPEDGQFDLSTYLATPRRFLPVPIVVTEPAIGYGGGLAAMFVRPRKADGNEGYAKPNMSIVGGIATENGTWAGFAGDSSHWLDERLQTLAAAGASHLNLDFYGLGNSSASLDEPVRYTLDFQLALLQGNWKLKPKSPWSVGLRYVYSQVDPKLRDEPQFPGLIDDTTIKISAPAAVLEYDSRNNLFTPTRGVFAESVYLASREELGATDDFERFTQVIMGWVPLADTWTLGVRADYQTASEGTPFFLRPYIKLRGVEAMRYQGDDMASVEVEARWQMRERWSLVGAAGFGSAKTDRALYSATRDVVSGAIGFRYKLASKFGMHAGIDVGYSEDTTAVYLQVGNAWFRP